MKIYVKSSMVLPANNECVPGWVFNTQDYTGSFKGVVDALSSRLMRLPFVSKVAGSGLSFEREGQFEVNLDVYLEKDFEDLTDSEIDAIGECGYDVGSVDFEI